MKLEDLINEENEITKARAEAISKVTELKDIGKEVAKLEESKLRELQTKCVNEVEEFFKNGGFEVGHNDKIIKAKHDSIEIEINNDCVDEALEFDVKIEPKNVYSTIQVRPTAKDIPMFYQKNILKIGNKNFDFKNYIDLINKCNNKGDLESLITRTEENINHYKNTINHFSEIKFVYSLYDTSIECSSFKEVFENYI